MLGASKKDLSGKVAVITGGAKRLGRAFALSLAEAGADVAITYLTSTRDAQHTVIDTASLGGRALAVRCDVRDEKSVKAAMKEIVRELGGVDILVNNAAVYESVDFEKLTAAQWDNMFATNTRGPFRVSRAALAALRERKGRIINLASLGGLRPWSTHAH